MINGQIVQKYASLLRECAKSKDYTRSKTLHLELVSAGYHSHTFIGNLLIQMFRCLGEIEPARIAFENIYRRNDISWNIMVTAYAETGHLEQARSMFELMPLWSVVTCNSYLNLLGQIGLVQDSKNTYDTWPEKTAVSWGAMAAVYAQNGHMHEAEELFGKAPSTTVVMWNTLIWGYGQDGNMFKARNLFDSLPEKSVVSWTCIITALAQNGHLHLARMVFEQMPERTVISWNVMISSYALNNHGRKAFELFQRMDLNGVQGTKVSLVSALDACSSLTVEDGKMVHEIIRESAFRDDTEVMNVCMNMFAKFGNVNRAKSVFDGLRSRDVISWTTLIAVYSQQGEVAKSVFRRIPCRNIVTYNTMMNILSQNGHLDEAKKMFHTIPVKDIVSWNVMLTSYSQNGRVEDARLVFEEIPDPNLACWNAMLATYAQNGYGQRALDLYKRMLMEGVKPDTVTLVSLLDACAGVFDLFQGEALHTCAVSLCMELEGPLGCSLVIMYGRCGRMQTARKVFDEMQNPNSVSYTAMMSLYAHDGSSWMVLELFHEMMLEGFEVNRIVFICVLSACSQAGEFDRGVSYLQRMKQDYGIEQGIDHFACMVDLLTRAGQLENAEEFITNLPCDGDDVVWKTLLASSRDHGYTEVASRACEQVMNVHSDSTPYVLLSNMCMMEP